MATISTANGAAATCSAPGCDFDRTYDTFRGAAIAAAMHAQKAQRSGDEIKHWVAVVNVRETVRVYGPDPINDSSDFVGAK